MSKYQKQNNLGEQFLKVATEALSTGDFQDLNTLISDTVTDALADAGKQVRDATSNASKTKSHDYSKIYMTSQQYQEYQRQRNEQFSQKAAYQKRTATSTQKTTLPAVKTKNIGQISSILYTVFGGIGIGATSPILLAGIICATLNKPWYIPVYVLLVVLLGGSGVLLRKGISEKNRLARMKRYISLCAGKMYINISDLAKSVGKSTNYILKDVKKMLKLGFFPEGHLDEKGTCLMLDDATYREYVRVEKERKAYELDTAQATPSAPKQTVTTDTSQNTNTAPSELDVMLREGQEYIRKLHELNDLIPGEVISEKMYHMESLLKEIFERVEEDPTQMTQMHKLMNYYLPTTIKLLQAYAEFDDVSTPGPDIIAAKTEIEKTVDTINEAFTELLNKLFQATVFDVTTDAQVLQTMLAKEGLTKNDFSEDKK